MAVPAWPAAASEKGKSKGGNYISHEAPRLTSSRKRTEEARPQKGEWPNFATAQVPGAPHPLSKIALASATQAPGCPRADAPR